MAESTVNLVAVCETIDRITAEMTKDEKVKLIGWLFAELRPARQKRLLINLFQLYRDNSAREIYRKASGDDMPPL